MFPACSDDHAILTLAHRGGTSLSPDGQLLAVSNLINGFDFHSLGAEGLPVNAGFEGSDMGEAYPTPVLFIGNGRYLLTGSSVGEARLWETQSAEFLPFSLESECYPIVCCRLA